MSTPACAETKIQVEINGNALIKAEETTKSKTVMENKKTEASEVVTNCKVTSQRSDNHFFFFIGF